jgi:hypothetical protein
VGKEQLERDIDKGWGKRKERTKNDKEKDMKYYGIENIKCIMFYGIENIKLHHVRGINIVAVLSHMCVLADGVSCVSTVKQSGLEAPICS